MERSAYNLVVYCTASVVNWGEMLLCGVHTIEKQENPVYSFLQFYIQILGRTSIHYNYCMNGPQMEYKVFCIYLIRPVR